MLLVLAFHEAKHRGREHVVEWSFLFHGGQDGEMGGKGKGKRKGVVVVAPSPNIFSMGTISVT